MDNNKNRNLIISIDFKNFLIRIHKKTLNFIGNPEYILLLVNPETLTLVILRSNVFDPKAHHMSDASLLNNKSFELYSRKLVETIYKLSDIFEKNKLYHIYGDAIPKKGAASFYIPNAISINEVK